MKKIGIPNISCTPPPPKNTKNKRMRKPLKIENSEYPDGIQNADFIFHEDAGWVANAIRSYGDTIFFAEVTSAALRQFRIVH